MSRISRRPSLIGTALFFALFFVSSTSYAATLGRGLQQLVELYERGNAKLASVLRLHVTNGQGDVLVHVRVADGEPAADVIGRLVAAGFRLQAVSELDPTLLEGYLPLSAARNAAAIRGVLHVLAVQRPFALAGAVQSQAVAVQNADAAHARGIDGAGTRVGVLSDSFNSDLTPPNAATDVATGDLPPGVVVLADLPPGEGADEGRAMLQLVHDVAPGARLGFATAFTGEVQFSNNILGLRRSFGADVIVDDVIYFDEPMFSDGLLAQTVDRVVSEGAAYFSSAGNNGLEAYEANYNTMSLATARRMVAEGKENIDIDALAAHGLPARSFHNFRNPDGSNSFTQRFTSYFGDIVDFQWDEPFDLGKVKTDYNIYVFDANGKFIDPNDPASDAFFTTDDNTETDQALELMAVNPGTYQIVIAKVNDGSARRLKYVVINGAGESDIQNAPSVFGHAAARRGQGVAAMYYGITKFPEDFSSPGPVTIFFDTRGRRLQNPDVRRVPQLTAVDGADTTFFGFDIEPNGLPNFFGTSAAAPNAAAVAALVLQSAGGPGHMSPEKLYQRLQKTATPMPLADPRTIAAALAGPLLATANGDFARETNYWQLVLSPFVRQTVTTVTINLTAADMLFSNPASPTTGFFVGAVRGMAKTDVTATRSLDRASLTLTFTPGAFGGGDFITFANFAFPSQLPVQFQVDADRVEHGQVSVSLSDGSTRTGTFRVNRSGHDENEKGHDDGHGHDDDQKETSDFTGAGLVNADAATQPR